MERMTIERLLKGYRQKEFSPVEVTRKFLDSIEVHNDRLNAYITVSVEKALNQAEIAEKKYVSGEQTGRIEGIPLSYKDMIDTKEIKTTYGSSIDQDHIPSEDAAIVHQLQLQGAVNLGKANLHEYAFGITSNNPFYGPVRNPWNSEYTAGGSSGGSGAAVASYLGLASIGTDTAGSIRIPASSCGVVGLKPTYGYLDAAGVKHLSWSMDHIGPLTNHVSDLATMMEAITGQSFVDYCREDVKGLRIGVPKNYFNEQLDDEVETLYHQALTKLEDMGAVLLDVDIPFTGEDLQLVSTLVSAEAGYVHQDSMKTSMDKFGTDVKAVLEFSQSISSLAYIEALKKRENKKHAFDQLLKNIDVLATPTLPTTPKKVGVNIVTIRGKKEDILTCMIRNTSVFNLTGHPALSIPCGLTSKQLPVGLQLVGGFYRERRLMHVAYAFEQQHLQDFYAKRDALYT